MQEPSSAPFNDATRGQFLARLDALAQTVRAELEKQGFAGPRVTLERMLNMRFDGTDTALMILPRDEHDDYGAAFARAHKEQFGFVLAHARVLVDDLVVRGVGRTFDRRPESVHAEAERLRPHVRAVKAKPRAEHDVYFDGAGRVRAPVYVLGDLQVGEEVKGPAVVIDETQTIVITPDARALVTSMQLYINLD